MAKITARNVFFITLVGVALVTAVLHSSYIRGEGMQVGDGPQVHHLRNSLKQSKSQHRELEREFRHERMGALHGLHEHREKGDGLSIGKDAVLTGGFSSTTKKESPEDPLLGSTNLNMKHGEVVPPALYLRAQSQIFDSFDDLPKQPPRMHAIIHKDRAKTLDKAKNEEWKERQMKFVSMGGGMKTRDCIHNCLDIRNCKQAECVRAVASQSLCDECIFEFYDAAMAQESADVQKAEATVKATNLASGYITHKGSAICGKSCASKGVTCYRDIKNDQNKCRELCNKNKDKCRMFEANTKGFPCMLFGYGPSGGVVDGDIKHVQECVGPTYEKMPGHEKMNV